MTDTTIRGANQITDAEFLAAYNDTTKTNAQVVEALQCGDWTAVGVKLRSERLQAHLTVERKGAIAKQTMRELSADELHAAAKLWKASGRVISADEWKANTWQSDAAMTAVAEGDAAERNEAEAQAAAAYDDAVEGEDEASDTSEGSYEDADYEDASNDDDQTVPADVSNDVTNVSPAMSTTAPVGNVEEIVTEEPTEVAFSASIFDRTYRFSGADMTEARHALMDHLVDLNFSKVAITDQRGNQVGLGEIAAGSHYVIKKQLTAA